MDNRTERNKSDFQFFVFLLIVAVIFGLLMNGCETVTIKECVTYEDNTPVKQAKVRQWTDTYKSSTITNDKGEWKLQVPPDVFINLCIENPRNNYKEACYENGYLLTPSVGSGVTLLKDIPK